MYNTNENAASTRRRRASGTHGKRSRRGIMCARDPVNLFAEDAKDAKDAREPLVLREIGRSKRVGSRQSDS